MNSLTVCADDFAQNEPISEGIIELAQHRRIHAISCMVNTPLWETGASLLNNRLSLKLATKPVAIGLHFNFTLGKALSKQWQAHYGPSFPPLTKLLYLLYTNRLNQAIIKHELTAQWDAFVEKMGRLPDFLDGHQHIHQYKHVRSLLCAMMNEKNYQGQCRSSTNGSRDLIALDAYPKAPLMYLLGGRLLKTNLALHQIETNTSFAGFYPFKQAKHYRLYFRRFLAKSKPAGLIMCHPGYASNDKTDPLYQTRLHEYLYLMSDAYRLDLMEFGFE